MTTNLTPQSQYEGLLLGAISWSRSGANILGLQVYRKGPPVSPLALCRSDTFPVRRRSP